jgi:hypothetical protein
MLPYKRTHAAQCRLLESMNDIIDTGQVLPYHTLRGRQQECKLPRLVPINVAGAAACGDFFLN